MSNYAPFQRWLAGDKGAMSLNQLRGANLFFGKADCVSCHNGPALSSPVGATQAQMFFAIGFADFDTSDPLIHGSVDDATSLGRGAFTGDASDNYKFKIPQLYNLKDSNVFGHGASFSSVREVIEYKNNGVPQDPASISNLSEKFRPLGLSSDEITYLVSFVEEALYDQWLDRYVPYSLPSDNCFPVADIQSALDLDCHLDETRTRPERAPACLFSDSDPDGDGWVGRIYRSCRTGG